MARAPYKIECLMSCYILYIYMILESNGRLTFGKNAYVTLYDILWYRTAIINDSVAMKRILLRLYPMIWIHLLA